MTRRRALLAWALLGRPRPRSGSGSLGKLHPHRAPQRVEGPGVRAQPAPKTARALRGGVARSRQRLRHPGLLPEAGPERAALPRADAGRVRRGLQVSEEGGKSWRRDCRRERRAGPGDRRDAVLEPPGRHPGHLNQPRSIFVCPQGRCLGLGVCRQRKDARRRGSGCSPSSAHSGRDRFCQYTGRCPVHWIPLVKSGASLSTGPGCRPSSIYCWLSPGAGIHPLSASVSPSSSAKSVGLWPTPSLSQPIPLRTPPGVQWEPPNPWTVGAYDYVPGCAPDTGMGAQP